MKARILFYVTPKFKWKYMVNWIITLWTRSKYSHVEIWTTDVTSVEDWNPTFSTVGGNFTCYHGTCYTATMRGDANGTVKRPAREVLKHPENWRYIEVELRAERYETMLLYMNISVSANAGYSKWDILKFISPVHFPDNKRNICSEFVNNALWSAGEFFQGGIVSPGKLYKKLIALGYESKGL